jgi:uncharacterized protein (TIGR03663 family)
MVRAGCQLPNAKPSEASGGRFSANRALLLGACLAIALLAGAFRVRGLDARPMHADEAVQAAKFQTLLETGAYAYDPGEYHGPTLNYATLMAARVRGISRFADLDETTLRIVPAVAGVLLVLAHLLLVPVIGFRAAVTGALIAAVSPAMVYYSRYYIHETLLAAFSALGFAAVCRYWLAPRVGWALVVGLSGGLMFATKETWVVPATALALAAGVTLVTVRRGTPLFEDSARTVRHAAVALGAALIVACMLFSSFLTHPRGLVDAVGAYGPYLTRAGGTSGHVHPWHYYLGLLLYTHDEPGPVWTEATIVGLAIAGAVLGWRSWGPNGSSARYVRLAAIYAAGVMVIYAAIPYKTPWCVLGMLDAGIVLAGVGGAWFVERSRRPVAKALVAVAMAAIVLHLGWLARESSGPYASDPRNPYVYAHTGTGVFEIVRQVDWLARAHPEHFAMPIEVITGQNLWPLPWYLRRYPATRWETAPVNDGVQAPVIITTPDMELAVSRKIYDWRRPGEREMYVPIFEKEVDLRPGVEVRGTRRKVSGTRRASADAAPRGCGERGARGRTGGEGRCFVPASPPAE